MSESINSCLVSPRNITLLLSNSNESTKVFILVFPYTVRPRSVRGSELRIIVKILQSYARLVSKNSVRLSVNKLYSGPCLILCSSKTSTSISESFDGVRSVRTKFAVASILTKKTGVSFWCRLDRSHGIHADTMIIHFSSFSTFEKCCAVFIHHRSFIGFTEWTVLN